MLSITDVDFSGGAVPNNARAGVQNMAAFVKASTVIQTTNPREFLIPKGTFYLDYRGDPGAAAITFQNVTRLICEGELVFLTEKGSVRITGQGMKVEGLNVKRPSTDERGGTWGNELFHLLNLKDSELIGCSSANSGASGTYIASCDGVELHEHATHSSYADGIHVTGSSKNILVKHSAVYGARDDYLACVSPIANGAGVAMAVCENIRFDDVWCRGQKVTGRGISVVGGKTVRYYDIDMDIARFSALIIASEPSYKTHGNDDILMCDVKCGEVLGKDTQAGTGDGITITGREGFKSSNISLHNIHIGKTKRHGMLVYSSQVDMPTLRYQVKVDQVGTGAQQLAVVP